MELWQYLVLFTIILYFAVCFGMIARRNGRNPFLWGVLSVLSPVNGLVLGYWAMTGHLPFNSAADSK